MKRRKFLNMLRGALIAGAATTGLARTSLAVVDDYLDEFPEPEFVGADFGFNPTMVIVKVKQDGGNWTEFHPGDYHFDENGDAWLSSADADVIRIEYTGNGVMSRTL